MASNGMEETLKRFGEQFAWHPVVENSGALAAHTSCVVAGMGVAHSAI
jgi:hypothetical protein